MKTGDDQRKFARSDCSLKVNFTLPGALSYDLRDLRHARIEGRAAFFGEQFISEDDVLRRDSCPSAHFALRIEQ